MKESYEKIRGELMAIIKETTKKLIDDNDDMSIFNVKPEEAALLARMMSVYKATDELMIKCIDKIEKQDRKLDLILMEIEGVKLNLKTH